MNICRKKYKATHFYFLGLPPRERQLNPLGLPLCEAMGVRAHTQHAQSRRRAGECRSVL